MKNEQLKLTSPIPPSVNHYLGYRAILKNGKPLAVSYCTPEAKRYKEFFAAYVKDEAKKQGWNLAPNNLRHFYVDAVFYFPRVDMDSSNYFKCMLDAITDTQLIWLDDNVVCERVQGIYYDSQNPRIELCIHPVDYVGVFKNQAELDKFESKCASCTRFSHNCTLLQKAKAGKVQEEICNMSCQKYVNKGSKG